MLAQKQRERNLYLAAETIETSTAGGGTITILRAVRPAFDAVAAMTKRIRIARTVRRALIIVGSKRGDIGGGWKGTLPQSRSTVYCECDNSDYDYEGRKRAKGWHGRRGGKLSGVRNSPARWLDVGRRVALEVDCLRQNA